MTYRYAVLVSTKHKKAPIDLIVGEVTYRHVNIAVDARATIKATALMHADWFMTGSAL